MIGFIFLLLYFFLTFFLLGSARGESSAKGAARGRRPLAVARGTNARAGLAKRAGHDAGSSAIS